MIRLKCSKCGNVFEMDLSTAVVRGALLHIGPYKWLKCPACGRRSMFNIYSSVKDPVTWPEQEKTPQAEPELTDEELELKRIEESKYEKGS
ncbi:MAG: hypothetical protein ABR962_05475 [Candidatus Bathyarchaeia archaeon]|jgi:DNA-directed RNA polymerase subunit RPC12/RpoP